MSVFSAASILAYDGMYVTAVLLPLNGGLRDDRRLHLCNAREPQMLGLSVRLSLPLHSPKQHRETKVV